MLPVLLSVVGLGLAVIVYATLIERNWYAVRRHRVPCLPAGSAPLRLLSVSDLHLVPRQRRKRRFLKDLSRFEPDLVIGTGDFLGDTDAVPATVEALGSLRARIAALFVLGSNDYYGPVFKTPLRYFLPRRQVVPAGPENPWPQMVAELEGHGWTLVNNKALDIEGIDVVGLDDAHIGRADLSVASPRNGDDRFRLAVSHSPDTVDELVGLGYDLIVCGHTHGGQVRIPGIGALVTNSDLPRNMARGLHRMNGSWLFVNAGLGTNKFAPYRFACRPEVAVLELVPRG